MKAIIQKLTDTISKRISVDHAKAELLESGVFPKYTPNNIKARIYQIAEHDGAKAFLEGHHPIDCPYIFGEPAYSWDRGYEKAAKKLLN